MKSYTQSGGQDSTLDCLGIVKGVACVATPSLDVTDSRHKSSLVHIISTVRAAEHATIDAR